jgi:hypothetical protein
VGFDVARDAREQSWPELRDAPLDGEETAVPARGFPALDRLQQMRILRAEDVVGEVHRIVERDRDPLVVGAHGETA